MTNNDISTEDLLFCLIAYKLCFVSMVELRDVVRDASRKENHKLASELVTGGHLSQQARDIIDQIVSDVIDFHQQDIESCLKNLRGREFLAELRLVQRVKKENSFFDVLIDPIQNFLQRSPGVALGAFVFLLGIVVVSVSSSLYLFRSDNGHSAIDRLEKLVESKTMLADDQKQLAKQKANFAEQMSSLAIQKSELARSYQTVVDRLVRSFQNSGTLEQEIPSQMTASIVLERALTNAQLDSDLDADGLTKARLLKAIGDSFYQIKEYEGAINAYSMASLIFGIEQGDEHPETMVTINSLGITYQDAGRLEAAIKTFKQAYQYRKEVIGIEHEQTYNSLLELARTYVSAGKSADAMPFYDEYLKTIGSIYGSNDRATGLATAEVAEAYRKSGDLEKAIEFFERSHDILVNELGGHHTEAIISQSNLGNAYSLMGKSDKANELLQEVFQIRSQRLGSGHPDTLATANDLATNYFHQGKLSNAVDMYDFVVKTVSSQSQDSNSQSEVALNRLTSVALSYASQLSEARRFQMARGVLSRTLETVSKSNSQDESKLAELRTSLGVLCLGDGDFEQAVVSLQKAAAFQLNLSGHHGAESLVPLEALAYSYAFHHNYLKAKELAEELLLIENTEFNRNKLRLVLVVVAATLGNYDEVIENLRVLRADNSGIAKVEIDYVNAAIEILRSYSEKSHEDFVEGQLPRLMEIVGKDKRYRRWFVCWVVEVIAENLQVKGKQNESTAMMEVAHGIRARITKINQRDQ